MGGKHNGIIEIYQNASGTPYDTQAVSYFQDKSGDHIVKHRIIYSGQEETFLFRSKEIETARDNWKGIRKEMTAKGYTILIAREGKLVPERNEIR